jgi:hypothetical protein
VTRRRTAAAAAAGVTTVVALTIALSVAVAAKSSANARVGEGFRSAELGQPNQADQAAQISQAECVHIGAAFTAWLDATVAAPYTVSDGTVEVATTAFAHVVQDYDDQAAQTLSSELANLSRLIQDAEITPVIQDQVVDAEQVVQLSGNTYTTCS